jgi:hypothetical protein
MVDQVQPVNSTSQETPDRGPAPARRSPVTAGDIVPLGPNLIAAFVGFVGLSAVPWVCLHVLVAIWEDAIGDDQVAGLFILADFERTLVIAVVGALLFLVIGAILQFWQYHHPFPSRRPAFLAFPIAWGLLMPEALMRGGSLLSGAVVGTAIALAFGVQWAAVVYLREAMD